MIGDIVTVLRQLESMPDWAQAVAVGVAIAIIAYGAYGNAALALRGTAAAGRLSWRGAAALLAWCRRPSQTALLRAEIAQLREELGA